MKKVLCIAMAALMAVSLSYAAEHEHDEDVVIGVGYQGLLLGDLLSGVAVRSKPAPIGWQAELVQGIIDSDALGDVDLLVLKGKGYYTLVENQHSVLYAGASLGYWMGEAGGGDIDGWSFAPLMGAEWSFEELPEIGFNFEVSYEFDMLDADGGGDINIYGINVTTGIVYYF